MKQYLCLASGIKVRYVLFLCLCCFIFKTTIGQNQIIDNVTVPDKSYGKGSKKTTIIKDVYKNKGINKEDFVVIITKEEYYDGSQPPKLMQKKEMTKADDGTIFNENTYYNGDGKKLSESYERKDYFSFGD